jgi:hypothetical protein
MKHEQVEQANQLWRESLGDGEGHQEQEDEWVVTPMELEQDAHSHANIPRSRKSSVRFSPDTMKPKV